MTSHLWLGNSSRESPKSPQGRKKFSAVPLRLNLSFHYIPGAKALGYFQQEDIRKMAIFWAQSGVVPR
jgi:hypothetical protein